MVIVNNIYKILLAGIIFIVIGAFLKNQFNLTLFYSKAFQAVFQIISRVAKVPSIILNVLY